MQKGLKKLRCNESDPEENTPLMLALYRSNENISFKEVNRPNEYGVTALMIASILSHHKHAVVLLEHGADTSAKDSRGRTALDHALGNILENVTLLLLSRGAHCNIEQLRLFFGNGWRGFPAWSRFGSAAIYPKQFADGVAIPWLLCCKRKLRKLPKDIRYLMIEYLAVAWLNLIHDGRRK